MKRILLFSHDPGGANTIIPLIAPLQKRGYSVLLYGDGTALERYCRAGFEGFSLVKRTGRTTPEAIEAFLCEERPDFLITSTSAEDYSEKYLWRAAKCLGVPSFAILDQWLNYGIRFSPWGLRNITAYEAAPEHPFVPSRLIVMDDFARDEIEKAHILPRTNILPLGQPYFETLFQRAAVLPGMTSLRAELGLRPDSFVITFVSEPISQDYGVEAGDGGYWGFTELTVFRSFLSALELTTERTCRPVHVMIKLHPRESAHNYDDFLGLNIPLITITADQASDPLYVIHASDLICGMSSMMLIEAALFKKPVISVMIGLKRESPFILERRGMINSIKSDALLEKRLLEEMSGYVSDAVQFNQQQNPVQAIIAEMERMLLL